MVGLKSGFGRATLAKEVVKLTCGGCDAVWTGPGRCHHCADGCHLTFGGRVNFDSHLKENGCITDPELLIEMGFELTPKGIWIRPF